MALALAATVVVLLGGCTRSNGPAMVSTRPPAPVDEVDRIFRQTFPAAVNWDGRPGPDGLEVCVHLFRSCRDLPVTVKGSLEFTIYEGVVGEKDIGSAKPFRSWRFSGEELKAHQIRLMMGWGYAMRLGWGQAVPTTSSVTLIVQYTPLTGRPVRASPITIPVGPR